MYATRVSDCRLWNPLYLKLEYTDCHFNSSLSRADPILIIVFFMATALNLLIACSRSTANFCLQMLKLVLKASVADPGQNAIIDSIPVDIRAARKIFPLDLCVTVYAACPSCHTLYPPTHRDGIDVYPARCTSSRFPDSPPCHARLCKLGVKKGYSVHTPIRPYAMQSFTAFLGAFYSCPGIEAAICSTNR